MDWARWLLGQRMPRVWPGGERTRSEGVGPKCPRLSAAAPDSSISSGLFVRRASRHTRQVLLLHALDVELRRAVAHLGDHRLGRRRLALDPAQRVDARDHEGAK